MDADMFPLFEHFPQLQPSLQPLSLGTFPTPVAALSGLERRINRSNLFIKRDDLSGEPYGGNKVRKLELLLGDARRMGAKRLITSGAAGSNHALATALYGTRQGFKTTLMLFNQPEAPGIAATLAADLSAGAEIFFDVDYKRHEEHIREMAEKYEQEDKCKPYLIPPGGSSAIGVIGYVNAAFELRRQIEGEMLPEPRAIYMAFGTMGSAAGLLLGLRAAGIRSKLVAIRVTPEIVANAEKFLRLFSQANELLREIDPSFPLCHFDAGDFEIDDMYLGDGYGIVTPAAREAIAVLSETNGIVLDGVYTGKAGAAFLAAAASGALRDKPLLYWHTKNSRSLVISETFDFHKLPEGLHRYFEE
jgi:1-aminocyclopropane-1-carboxylate deaminase/D-cysteine desulfhydrase-like pyridoxal-dependent ACC family enzyme